MMPTTPGCQPSAPTTSAARRAPRPRGRLRQRLRPDQLLDALPLRVPVVELGGQPVGVARRGASSRSSASCASPSRPAALRRGARRKPTSCAVMRRRLAARRSAASASQPGALARRQRAQAGGDQDAVLVDERHQVGDRAQRHQVEQLARIEARGCLLAQRASAARPPGRRPRRTRPAP